MNILFIIFNFIYHYSQKENNIKFKNNEYQINKFHPKKNMNMVKLNKKQEIFVKSEYSLKKEKILIFYDIPIIEDLLKILYPI